MIERCRHGPPAARVSSIDIDEEADAPPSGFEMLPTV
jgi:hypothetical protein